jgi:hypothetical protein
MELRPSTEFFTSLMASFCLLDTIPSGRIPIPYKLYSKARSVPKLKVATVTCGCPANYSHLRYQRQNPTYAGFMIDGLAEPVCFQCWAASSFD